jgi:hypothetical protein
MVPALDRFSLAMDRAKHREPSSGTAHAKHRLCFVAGGDLFDFIAANYDPWRSAARGCVLASNRSAGRWR